MEIHKYTVPVEYPLETKESKCDKCGTKESLKWQGKPGETLCDKCYEDCLE